MTTTLSSTKDYSEIFEDEQMDINHFQEMENQLQESSKSLKKLQIISKTTSKADSKLELDIMENEKESENEKNKLKASQENQKMMSPTNNPNQINGNNDNKEICQYEEHDKYTKPFNHHTSFRLSYIIYSIRPFFDSLKFIYPVFILNFLFFLFTNILNTSILSGINFTYGNNEELIESIGFTNTMFSITLYPLYVGFSNIFAILGSQAYGANKFDLLKFILNQTRLFGVLFSILVGFIYLLLHPHIGILFNLPLLTNELSLSFSSFRFIGYFFEFEIYITLTYLQIIEKGVVGLYILLMLLPFIPNFSSFMINYMKSSTPNVYGVGIVYIIINVTLFVLLKIYTICILDEERKEKYLSMSSFRREKNRKNKKYIVNKYNDTDSSTDNDERRSLSDNSSVDYDIVVNDEYEMKEYVKDNDNIENDYSLSYKKSNIISYICLLLQSFQLYSQNFNIILISFLDLLSFEMISYLAVFTPKGDYPSYIVVNSIYGALQCINMAYSNCANVNIGYFIGKGDVKKGKSYFSYLLIQINVLILLSCGVSLFFKEEILNYLVEKGELRESSSNLFKYVLIVNIEDATFNILFSTLKTLNENRIALYITFGYNIFNFSLMFYFAFYLKYGIVGLYYGFITSDCIIILILIFIFMVKVDWNEVVRRNLEEIQENEKFIKELEFNMKNLS